MIGSTQRKSSAQITLAVQITAGLPLHWVPIIAAAPLSLYTIYHITLELLVLGSQSSKLQLSNLDLRLFARRPDGESVPLQPVPICTPASAFAPYVEFKCSKCSNPVRVLL